MVINFKNFRETVDRAEILRLTEGDTLNYQGRKKAQNMEFRKNKRKTPNVQAKKKKKTKDRK